MGRLKIKMSRLHTRLHYKWQSVRKFFGYKVIIKSTCGLCGKSMTYVPHGKMRCGISYEDGCPDKGDGGW